MDQSVAELTSATPTAPQTVPAAAPVEAPVTTEPAVQPVVATPAQVVDPEPPAWFGQITARPPAPPQYVPQEQPWYPPQQRPPERRIPDIAAADLIERPGEILSSLIGTSLEPIAQQLVIAQERINRQEARAVEREIGKMREGLTSGFKNVVSKDTAYTNPMVRAALDNVLKDFTSQAVIAARENGDFSMIEAVQNPGFMRTALYIAKEQAGYSGGETPRALGAPMVETPRSAQAPQSVSIDDDMRDVLRQRGISEEAYAKQLAYAKEHGFGF